MLQQCTILMSDRLFAVPPVQMANLYLLALLIYVKHAVPFVFIVQCQAETVQIIFVLPASTSIKASVFKFAFQELMEMSSQWCVRIAMKDVPLVSVLHFQIATVAQKIHQPTFRIICRLAPQYVLQIAPQANLTQARYANYVVFLAFNAQELALIA